MYRKKRSFSNQRTGEEVMDEDHGNYWESAQYDDVLETIFKAGYSYGHGIDTQEFIVIDHSRLTGEHVHTILDEYENEIYSSEEMGMVSHIGARFGPFDIQDELIEAWRQSLRWLDTTDDQLVAQQMASQVISAGRGEWWLGPEPEDPLIAEVTDLVFHLETPDGDAKWRTQQWQRIHALLDTGQDA
jgi:hypothetical protein